MEEKSKFAEMMADVEKGAKGFFDGVVKVLDKTGDGQLDTDDALAVADAIGETVKKSAKAVADAVDETIDAIQLKVLQPIFPDDLFESTFFLPKFIRVTDREKAFIEKDICKGSIGYYSDQKELRIVNMFRDSIDKFRVSFYPDQHAEFYYVDPVDPKQYIALDDYFSQLKIARINELQKIAQDLGARHFKVTYKVEKTYLTKKNAKINVDGAGVAHGEGEHDYSKNDFSIIDIEGEMSFPGHSPIQPRLKYLAKDPTVQTLIEMRMHQDSPLQSQKLTINMSNTIGITSSDAAKIDAVLKGMKCTGNASVSSEVKNESRRFLEYEIDF